MKRRLLLFGLAVLLLPGPADATDIDIVIKKEADPASEGLREDRRVHLVREGETLSGILLDAGFTLAEADRLIPAVLRLNPHLSDPDAIFPGQELTLPLSPPAGPTPGPQAAIPRTVPDLRNRGLLLPLLERTFEGIDEQILASGLLRLPAAEGSAVTIDNSVFPLLELSTGRDLILDLDGRMPDGWESRIEERWPGYDVVRLPQEGGYRDLLGTLLGAGGFHALSRRERVTFGRAARVSIVPDFLIVKTPDSLLKGSLYVLNALESGDEALPEDIRKLAESHRISIVEVLPVPGPSPPPEGQADFPRRSVRKLIASGVRSLLPELLPLIGFPDPSSDPYSYPSRQDPAISLELFPSLRYEWRNREVLVFFEPPDGAALEELSEEKVRPLVFSPSDTLEVVLGTILNDAGRSYSGPAVEFFRPDERFSIALSGFYLTVDGKPTLLTAGEVPPRVASLLADSGISVLSCIIR